MEKKRVISLGIDVGKESLYVCASWHTNAPKDHDTEIFKNDEDGFVLLCAWFSDILEKAGDVDSIVVMEATGIYHEKIAHFMYDKDYKVAVINPFITSKYISMINKTKTDKSDSIALSNYGLTQRINVFWKPMDSECKDLREYTRYYTYLKGRLKSEVIELHTMESAHDRSEFILESQDSHIVFLRGEITKTLMKINLLVEKNSQFKRMVYLMTTIPGIGFITAAIILGETNCFKDFRTVKQLVSYAGLDVKERQSGSYTAPPKISKRGNSNLRSCLYMPAISANRCNPKISIPYSRIVERNPKAKKKGIVASMRRLLQLSYVLCKKDEVFNPNHQWNRGLPTSTEPQIVTKVETKAVSIKKTKKSETHAVII